MIIEVIDDNKSIKIKTIQVKNKLTELERIKCNGPNVVDEKIFSEITDRQLRARDIILFNVPEYSTSTYGQLNENLFVGDLFNTIDISTNPISIRRLVKITFKQLTRP